MVINLFLKILGITNVSQSDAFEGNILESKTSGNMTEQSLLKVNALSTSTNCSSPDGKPPPLPPKKKHSK